MWSIFDIIVFVAGFAACWFSKDKIKVWVMGAETFAATLEDKIRALKAKL